MHTPWGTVRTSVVPLVFLLFTATVLVAQIPTTPPLSNDQAMTGMNGATFKYDDLINDWLGSGAVVVKACVIGGRNATCLFVPKFGSSSQCDLDGSTCGVGTATSTRFCMVTDEFSLIGLGLAMQRLDRSSRPTAFGEWVNALRLTLRYEPTLPLWNVVVDTSGSLAVVTGSPANNDDASDATARVIRALYIAASRSDRTDSERREYRLLADEISRGLQKDFVAKSETVEIGGGSETITHWLATGWQTARNSSPYDVVNDPFAFAGYFGDVTLALIAAAKGALSDRGTYATLADQTVKNYLRAAKYTSSFSVPPVSFRWLTGANADCRNPFHPAYCSTDDSCLPSEVSWDYFDAPRAISICESPYAAALAGVSLPSALDPYCNAWLAAGFRAPPTYPDYTYARRYSLNGTPCSIGGSYQENGLAVAMHFAYARTQFEGRLGMAFNTYQRSAPPHKFKDDNCLGVFAQAWPFLNYGSGLGRDAAAYQTPDANSIALSAAAVNASKVDINWSPASGASSYRVERRTTGSSLFMPLDTVTGTTFPDTTVTPNNAYLYHVTALDSSSTPLGTSNDDLAVTSVYAQVLTETVTKVKATDVNELRTAITAVCELAGTTPPAGSSVSIGDLIQTSDINSLRAAIESARTLLGLSPIAYLQTPISAMTSFVRASDIRELRRATN
jgi:hypothetical protein